MALASVTTTTTVSVGPSGLDSPASRISQTAASSSTPPSLQKPHKGAVKISSPTHGWMAYGYSDGDKYYTFDIDSLASKPVQSHQGKRTSTIGWTTLANYTVEPILDDDELVGKLSEAKGIAKEQARLKNAAKRGKATGFNGPVKLNFEGQLTDHFKVKLIHAILDAKTSEELNENIRLEFVAFENQ